MRLYATVAKTAEYTADVELFRPYGASTELFGVFDATAEIYFPNYSFAMETHYGVASMWAVPAMIYIVRGRIRGKAVLSAHVSVPARAAIAAYARASLAGEILRLRNTTGWLRGRAAIATFPRTSRVTLGNINGRSQSYGIVLSVKSLGSAWAYGNSRLTSQAASGRALFAFAQGDSSALGEVAISRRSPVAIAGRSSVLGKTSAERQGLVNARGRSRVSVAATRNAPVAGTCAGSSRMFPGFLQFSVATQATSEGKTQFYSTPEILDMTNLVVDPINSPIVDPQGDFLSSP